MSSRKWLSLTTVLALPVWFGIACNGQPAVPVQISTPTADRSSSPPFTSPSDIAALVPADGASVDIMSTAYPRRWLELTNKLQQGVAQNDEWWTNAVKTGPRGEPVPYDPRMGLTQDEYDEILVLQRDFTLAVV